MPRPCGRCEGCFQRRQGDWVERNMRELQAAGGTACFLTLTYADEHLPENGGVSVPDFQGFMHRLRKAVLRAFGVQLRFFGCLEYGDREDRLKRPHVHVLVYGWWPEDAEAIEASQGGWPQWQSDLVARVWGKGRCVVSEVSPQSIAYVVGYFRDRQYGDDAEAAYGAKVHPGTGELHRVRPPVLLMSRRPGIGSAWCSDFIETDVRHPVLRSARSNALVPMPRAYVRRLLSHIEATKGLDAREAEQLRRREEAAAAAAARAADNTPDRLLDRELAMVERRRALVRGSDSWSRERIVAQADEAGFQRSAEAEAMRHAARVSEARAWERRFGAGTRRRVSKLPATEVKDGR